MRCSVRAIQAVQYSRPEIRPYSLGKEEEFQSRALPLEERSEPVRDAAGKTEQVDLADPRFVRKCDRISCIQEGREN